MAGYVTYEIAPSNAEIIAQTGSCERVFPDDTGNDPLFTEHAARYDFARQYVKGLRVLDAACGTGYGSAMLADAGACSVLGVDISSEAIEFARRQYGTKRNLEFIQASVFQLTRFVSGPFDLCVSFETIEHLEEPERFLSDVRSLLSPGGRLLISTPNRYIYSPLNRDGRSSHNPFHKIEWTTEEFTHLLSEHFTVMGVYGQVFFSLNAARMHRWAQYFRSRFPKGHLTSPFYALAGLRKRAPFDGAWRAFRARALKEAQWNGIMSNRNTPYVSPNAAESQAVRVARPREVAMYSICLCSRGD